MSEVPLQVMWKHLYEASFPMTQEQYNDQLDAVAWYSHTSQFKNNHFAEM